MESKQQKWILVENPTYAKVLEAHKDLYGTSRVELGGKRRRLYLTIGHRTGLDTRDVERAYDGLVKDGIIDCEFLGESPRSYQLGEGSLKLYSQNVTSSQRQDVLSGLKSYAERCLKPSIQTFTQRENLTYPEIIGYLETAIQLHDIYLQGQNPDPHNIARHVLGKLKETKEKLQQTANKVGTDKLEEVHTPHVIGSHVVQQLKQIRKDMLQQFPEVLDVI